MLLIRLDVPPLVYAPGSAASATVNCVVVGTDRTIAPAGIFHPEGVTPAVTVLSPTASVCAAEVLNVAMPPAQVAEEMFTAVSAADRRIYGDVPLARKIHSGG